MWFKMSELKVNISYNVGFQRRCTILQKQRTGIHTDRHCIVVNMQSGQLASAEPTNKIDNETRWQNKIKPAGL